MNVDEVCVFVTRNKTTINTRKSDNGEKKKYEDETKMEHDEMAIKVVEKAQSLKRHNKVIWDILL